MNKQHSGTLNEKFVDFEFIPPFHKQLITLFSIRYAFTVNNEWQALKDQFKKFRC